MAQRSKPTFSLEGVFNLLAHRAGLEQTPPKMWACSSHPEEFRPQFSETVEESRFMQLLAEDW